MNSPASATFSITRNPFGQLVLRLSDGTEHIGVIAVRAFPIDAPDEDISLVGTDGHERVWIEQLDVIDAPARQLIREELALREFVPVIARLVSVSTFATPSVWQVETDRGDTTFVLDGEEDIRRLAGDALIIAASNGVFFKINSMGALDKASRRLIERFL